MRARLLLTHALAAALALGAAAALPLPWAIAAAPVAALLGWAAARSLSRQVGALARNLAVLEARLARGADEVTAERDRLSATLAGMLEGVLVVAPGRRVTIANRSAEEILEAGGSLVGRTAIEAIRHPGAHRAIEAALAGAVPPEEDLEVRGRAIELTARPLPVHAGGGAVVVLHDVTRLRRLERTRRDFVANVSHELNTPIASIQAYAETLVDAAAAEPEQTRRFAEVIHRNARRVGRLVRDLLTLSQLETDAPERRPREAVSVRDAADHALEVAGRGAAVEVEVPEGLEIAGEADGLEQILVNLVDNAIKHGRPGGRVRIAAAPAAERGWVELCVEDDGPGIESRHLARLFERFYRPDPGRSRDEGGTGLGLAIVKHLAEAMGGSVAVASELGKGTRFTVRLPAASDQESLPT